MIRRLLGLVLVVSMRLFAQTGTSLPPWTPGTLDFHPISTGCGNATFFIQPDVTTLLVDAGAAGAGAAETDPHPDGSRMPGAWIGRYIRRHLPLGVMALDYAPIT